MKVRFLLICLILCVAFACTPPKKTQELESRITELERLLEQIETTQLTQQQRQTRVKDQVSALVEEMSEEDAKRYDSLSQKPVTMTPPAPKTEDAPQSQPVKEPLTEPVVKSESLSLIKPSPQIQHKPFSSKKIKDGKRIVQKLTKPVKELKQQATHPLLGKKLPQSRFIGPNGKVFDLNDYKGDKNVLLVIMRGFAGQVCIACSAQTAVLASTNQRFASKDTQIIVIYPGPPSSIPAFLKAIKDLEASFELPFPILLDINLAAVKKLRIEGALAKPTSLILNKEGIVRYAYTGKKYDDRPPVRDLLRAVDKLN